MIVEEAPIPSVVRTIHSRNEHPSAHKLPIIRELTLSILFIIQNHDWHCCEAWHLKPLRQISLLSKGRRSVIYAVNAQTNPTLAALVQLYNTPRVGFPVRGTNYSKDLPCCSERSKMYAYLTREEFKEAHLRKV